MTKYPRLFVNNKFNKIVHPIRVTINQNIVPLDTATITLPDGENLPARSYVELFTPYGSAGMFRVRSPHDVYGQGTTTAELEHMISEVGDYVVKEKISEMLPANTAMKKVFSHYGGSKWKLGSVTALGTDKVAVEADHDRILDTMLSILEQKPDCMMAFNFTTTPWTVLFKKKDETVTAEGRLARNIVSADVSYDDTELCTRVWYQTYTKKNGKVTETWKSKDADTKKTYGIVEGVVNTSSDMTADEINTTVDTYLKEHKNPRFNVTIQAAELSKITGESLDKFVVGKRMRLNLVDYKAVFEDVITAVVWSDPYSKPNEMTVTLGTEEDTVVTFLHNLDATGSGGGGGGKKKKEEEEKWKEYYTQHIETDYRIDLNAVRVDKANTILEKAGLSINSKGVLIYATTKDDMIGAQFKVTNEKIVSTAKDLEKGLKSEIKQTADDISIKVRDVKQGLEGKINVQAGRVDLVVKGTGANAKVNVGQITLAINESGDSEARIDAQKVFIGNQKSTVVIGGKISLSDVTAEHIQSQIMELATLTANAMNCSGNILCGSVDANHLYCEGEWEYNILDAEVSGNTLTLHRVTGEDITFSKATSLSGAWSGNTYTVTASPQGNTNTITPSVTPIVPGGAPSANVNVYLTTPTASSPYYETHGDPKTMYLVQSGLTVMLRNVNDATTGSGKYTYALTTIPNASVSGSWSGNTWTATSTHGGSASVIPEVHPVSSQGGAYVDIYVGTANSGGYDDHGSAKKLYLVNSGLTVYLKSENSTSSGTVYAQKTATVAKSNISLSRGAMVTTKPSTDADLTKVSANGYYKLTVTVGSTTKTWSLQVAV